ncbi:MAG: HD domain-containing protein, partial [Deltaproteobacteria bacterium]|nr:HD domain-containing protein [Deltaproteobacteria bacterium]
GDESEFEIMKRHTVIGGDTLKLSEEIIRKKFTYLTMARHIAYSHHEKFDGSGYPNGTKGEEIPLSARIVAVADVYDAMTSKRCYKDAFSHETAKKFILDQAGKHFDDEVVEAFLVVEAEFIGIMERMNS